MLTREAAALAGPTPLAAARGNGGFTTVHQRFRDAAHRKLGDAVGTRALNEVLKLHRTTSSGGR